jgi:hypothetical protein
MLFDWFKSAERKAALCKFDEDVNGWLSVLSAASDQQKVGVGVAVALVWQALNDGFGSVQHFMKAPDDVRLAFLNRAREKTDELAQQEQRGDMPPGAGLGGKLAFAYVLAISMNEMRRVARLASVLEPCHKKAAVIGLGAVRR